MDQRNKTIVTFGGWYQRTTLHLSEIYGFLASGFTQLDLSKEKLQELRQKMDLKEVTRETGSLEYVKAQTNSGIQIRYYEDGLYILELYTGNIEEAAATLKQYFEEVFNPGISYIFSLGAPTPKVLANIQTEHPTVISVTADDPSSYQIDPHKFGGVYSQVTSQGVTVFKTRNYIFIVTDSSRETVAQDLVDMQIFFREFKDQLEKYLNIHRKIWEEISAIKERSFIKGSEVENVRTKLDSYQKTINLIGSRINQMNAYIHTRASIAKGVKIETQLVSLFQYKFEVLSDTHSYIKEIWRMTADYLSTAIDVVKDIENRGLNNNIRSLQVITSIGVLSGILGYLGRDTLPKITYPGLIYFFILLIVIWPINYGINLIYKNHKYKITFPERATNI
ncbi:MAG: hypothetical protein UW73_C0005G0025 [Microgenomates group bacterium GW2011_GWB1_44_8]|nr:MAG: hypothetical protein UW73_C0005G0025 [Microgenomates group bacterium GW2011_GWB1_44_8]